MDTIRQKTVSLLSKGECGAKSISKLLRIGEKEVYEHLGHIARSVKSRKMRLRIIPAWVLNRLVLVDNFTETMRHMYPRHYVWQVFS